MTAEAFSARADVSRETMERLERYEILLRQWQGAINLVGKRTLEDVWRRHFLDSAQLLSHVPEMSAGPWVDLGSGAGFPGLVMAILGASDVHLVESDLRKCIFLRQVARETETVVTVHNCRIEEVPVTGAAVISARALAPVARLLELAEPLAREDTIFLFPKGQDVDAELTEAAKYWNITPDRLPSQTATDGVILRWKGLRRHDNVAFDRRDP
ncbi:16S rRNA (guanine(527)-N(7))-methyltransferase RsmG [Oceanibacterium hippocampi]